MVYDAEYAYYANGWLKSVKSGASDVADYTYDVVGNREQVDLGNGTYTVYAYDTDPRYRLTTITHKNSSDATLATIDYTSTARDKVGNPKSMTDWTGTWAYGYDDMNRLTSASAPAPVPGQPAGGSGALAYEYDWVGNRVRPPADPNPPSNVNKMVYNKADQLTSWPGMRQYTYYGDGSLQHVLNAGGTSTLASYTYTPTGLLAAASFGDSRTLTNTWDANANRVTLTTPGTTYDLTREFAYDPTAGVPAVVQETQVNDPQNPNDDVHVYYFREPNGSLIARVEDGSVHYYHFDALGSTRLLTNADADITDKYAYDAYGSLISHDRLSGSVDQPYQYVGRLGYYTHYQEPEFGLLQLGVRFYDPEVGRFTQMDPARDGLNWYRYAGSNPCTSVDPWGKEYRGINPVERREDLRELGYWTTWCASRARHSAINIVQQQYPGSNIFGDNLENAVLHRTFTCMIAGQCGREAAVVVTNNHERYNWNPRTGPMDLANNKEGLNCFDWAPRDCPGRRRDYGRTCLDCCLKRRQTGNLHLTPPIPVPDYPGGNS